MNSSTEDQINLLVDRGIQLGIQNLTQAELLDRVGGELDAIKNNESVTNDIWYVPDRSMASNATRFLRWQENAFRQELCDSDHRCLKGKYRKILESEGTTGQLKAIANALIAALAPQYAVPSLIVTIAMWLVKIQLDSWCAGRNTSENAIS